MPASITPDAVSLPPTYSVDVTPEREPLPARPDQDAETART